MSKNKKEVREKILHTAGRIAKLFKVLSGEFDVLNKNIQEYTNNNNKEGG